MRHKWITISLAIVFLLGCLTYYANRVLLPTFVKNLAIENAQKFLHRKVEIESLHFNWLRGVMVNRIKIYQKDSTTNIFFQAERISSAIVFIPGIKKHSLVFPNVKIESPSGHLIHQADNQWNFSDLLNAAPEAKPVESPINVSVGMVTITGGRLLLEDNQPQGVWSEDIDQINLKTGLSFSGIGVSFDGSLAIPKKQGFISLAGTYSPSNQTLKTDINIKNIKPADYLSLVPGKLPLTLMSATIKEVKAQVDYAPENIKINGDWSIKNLDATFAEHNVKADIDLTNATIGIKKNVVNLKGGYSFTNTQITTPTLFVAGSFKATVDDFLMNSIDDITMKATVSGDSLQIKLPNEQTFSGQLLAQINNSHWQKDKGTLEGHITLNQASISLSERENITGSLELKNIKARKDKTSTHADLDINLKRLAVRFPGKILKGDLLANHLNVSLDDKNTIKINTALDFQNIDATLDKTTFAGSVHLTQLKLSFDQTQQILDAQSKGSLDQITLKIDEQKALNTTTRFDLQVSYPLKKPADLTYQGTVALEQTNVQGLPFGDIKNLNLNADIKTDAADIKKLTLEVLETPIAATGTVKNFTKPLLNIQARSENFDLSKLKTLAPHLLKPYGLNVDGRGAFQVQFAGPALDPLSASIIAEAKLENVNVESSTLHQKLNNISGTFKADGETLSWNDFTATYMDKTATLNGHLRDFKNPTISTSLAMDGLELNGELEKNDSIITIKSIAGHYLSAQFNSTGTIDVSSKTPQLKLNNDLKFKLEDLSNFLPAQKKSLDGLKLSGLIVSKATLSGPAANWKDWTVTLHSSSDAISAAGLKFESVNLDLNQDEQQIKKFNIISNFYDGNLNVVTTADLRPAAIPFEIAIHLENTNLAKLKNDTPAKDEDLRGFIAFTTMIKGDVSNMMNLTGNGALNISQGYLMKKEYTSLFLISELNNLIFTDATANFDIANQKVTTENFTLKSEGATLNGNGWVGFDHRLQFELHPEFNSNAIAQSGSLKKGPSAIIALAASKYLTINIDGTLEKPGIHTIKKPTELIKKTGEILKDNVGQILEGIFQ